MATTLFLLGDRATTHLGHNVTRENGTGAGWDPNALSTTAGTGLQVISCDTVNGPTNGIELGSSASTTLRHWISDPVSAGFTLSGTITFNLWMAESAMANNAGAQCIVEVIRATDNSLVRISNSERGVELGTARAANNWTDASPTSTTINRGDRLRVMVLVNDIGTMVAAVGGANLGYSAGTGGADGDSFVSFTETFSFESAPSGTPIYLTDTASTVNPGSAVEKVASLSRGSGAVSKVTNTTSGWVAPIQWTDGGGGSAIEWYSVQLQAFTLTGLAKANLRLKADAVDTPNVSAKVEIARVESDGSSPTVWCSWCMSPFDATASGGDGELNGAAESAEQFYLSGDDLAVSDGQRLRIRVYLDDASHLPMVTAHSGTLWYAGTSGGASGDSFITLAQTVSEAIAAAPVLPPAFNAIPFMGGH